MIDSSGTDGTQERSLGVTGYNPDDPLSSFYDDPSDETDSHGGEPSLGNWLDGVALDVLPGAVPFERIGAAARTGFTEEEARSLLHDPDRLRLLKTIWRLSAPGAEVLDAAVTEGPGGRLHRELLARTRQTTTLRSRSRYGLAAATGGPPEVLVDDLRPSTAVLITRRIYRSDGVVDVVVESAITDPAARFPVVALLGERSEDHPGMVILFLLTPSPDAEHRGRCEVTLPLSAQLTGEHLQVYSTPLEATRLTASLLTAVPGSVAVAKRPWKEAWRQAALATTDDHPLRQAVLDGLSAGPA